LRNKLEEVSTLPILMLIEPESSTNHMKSRTEFCWLKL